jgi:hypothetical protein
MVRKVIKRGDNARPATTQVVQQSEEHLAKELGRNPIRGERVSGIGQVHVMGVELGIDTLNTVHETRDSGSGHGTPPLIGNCAASEDDHISIGRVVCDLNGNLARHCTR